MATRLGAIVYRARLRALDGLFSHTRPDGALLPVAGLQN